MVINYCNGYERREKKRKKMYHTITADHDVAVMQAVRKISSMLGNTLSMRRETNGIRLQKRYTP